MKDAIANRTLGIACPTCGHKTKKTFKWLKQNAQFTCACGKNVTIDQAEFKAEYAKVERELGELDKTLKKLFKK